MQKSELNLYKGDYSEHISAIFTGMMRIFMFTAAAVVMLNVSAQKLVYDVELFGKKIGQTIVERIEKADGEIQYKLSNLSDVTIFFTRKTSEMKFDITYKNGQLFSSYAKNVKDGVTEIVTMLWQGSQYFIHKGDEILKLNNPITYSGVMLYFNEPVGITKVFSERIGEYTVFTKTANGEYQCKTPNGVTNIYRYQKGKLMELEMNKGASVIMRLVQ